MRRLLTRTRKWILASAAGSTLVLGGCDPTVRDTVLSGVESAATVLSTTFLRAFFETLDDEGEGDATIVRAIAQDSAAIFS